MELKKISTRTELEKFSNAVDYEFKNSMDKLMQQPEKVLLAGSAVADSARPLFHLLKELDDQDTVWNSIKSAGNFVARSLFGVASIGMGRPVAGAVSLGAAASVLMKKDIAIRKAENDVLGAKGIIGLAENYRANESEIAKFGTPMTLVLSYEYTRLVKSDTSHMTAGCM